MPHNFNTFQSENQQNIPDQSFPTLSLYRQDSDYFVAPNAYQIQNDLLKEQPSKDIQQNHNEPFYQFIEIYDEQTFEFFNQHVEQKILQQADLILKDDKSGKQTIIQNYPIYLNKQGCFDLEILLHELKQKLPPLSEATISIYDQSQKIFIYVGQGSLTKNFNQFPLSQISNNNQIFFQYHSSKANDEVQVANEKRVKERNIEEVVLKVIEWRKLHEIGILNENTKGLVRLTLDAAAEQVGIPRKTLDDYFLQIRRAQQYNFDFAKHLKLKMGVIRNFNKELSKNSGLMTQYCCEIPMHYHQEEEKIMEQIILEEVPPFQLEEDSIVFNMQQNQEQEFQDIFNCKQKQQQQYISPEFFLNPYQQENLEFFD